MSRSRSILRVGFVQLNMFKPSSIFTDYSKAVPIFWIIVSFEFRVCLCYTVLSFSCSLEKGWSLGPLACYVFLGFVSFPYGGTGQVWYKFVLILDTCLLPYVVFLFF